MKTFRDPIHNIIRFDKNEDAILLELIDSREFQRLRHIKQLGFSSFTYPGAEHTRFAHSLGVAHLMKRFIHQLSCLKDGRFKRDIEELREHRILALAAALLHDIGHGPFSHALEKTTGVRHEKWTIEMIRGDTEVNSILRKYNMNPHDVVDVILRTHSSKPVVKLLSSQLDTDRIDYLLRDSLMTGAGYGTFDLEWLINVLTIGEYKGETEIGLDREKGLSIAEDFVMARYYMYVNVYFHKATRSAELIADGIFSRAYELHNAGQIELPDDLSAILAKKGQLPETLDHYLNLTDNSMWHFMTVWKNHPDVILSDLCGRIVNRRLFKSLPADGDKLIEFTQSIIATSQRHNLPIQYYFPQDQAKSSSYKDAYIQYPHKDEAAGEQEASERIVLFNKQGNGVELSEDSDIINRIRNKNITISRFYSPHEYKQEIMGG